MDEDNCPHCGVSFIGSPIPKEHLDCYGGKTHYKTNVTGIEIRGVYDGVLFWKCDKCLGTWHRWSDPYMRAKAQPYIKGPELCVGETGFHAIPHRGCILR